MHGVYDIFFDDTHDITLASQDLKLADDSNIVKQRLTIRLQFLLAEWFLDNTAGVPYTQTIFRAGTSLTQIDQIIRRKILDTDGVASIVSLDLTPDTRTRGLRIDFECIEESGNSTGLITIQV